MNLLYVRNVRVVRRETCAYYLYIINLMPRPLTIQYFFPSFLFSAHTSEPRTCGLNYEILEDTSGVFNEDFIAPFQGHN